MTHHLQDRCVCMIFKNWKKKKKQTQLSEETRQESDEWQHSTDSHMVRAFVTTVWWWTKCWRGFRVWCQRSSCRSRCSWTTCWGFQSHCLLLGNTYFRVSVVLNNYLFALNLGRFVGIPELVRDWHDLDFPMSVMRLAAAIQPSLEVLRLRTNLRGHKTHKSAITAVLLYTRACFTSPNQQQVEAVFSPLPVIPLLDELHHVSALHWELLSAALLIISHHCVFAGTLLRKETKESTKSEVRK